MTDDGQQGETLASPNRGGRVAFYHEMQLSGGARAVAAADVEEA